MTCRVARGDVKNFASRSKSIALLCLAGAVSGCTVGPNYQRPQTSTPADWGELAAADAATQPSTRPSGVTNAPARLAAWWKVFDDPVLDRLIERGVQSNLDLRGAQARLRQARAQRGVVAADFYPTVNAAGGFSHSRSSPAAFGGFSSLGRGSTGSSGTSSFGGFGIEQNLYQVGFDASWEVDVFGGVRRNIEAANADIQAAVENRRDVLVTLLAEIARNYVDLRSFQHQSAIARENLVAQRGSLELTRTRFAAGLATELDVSQAQAQVSSTEAQIPAFETSARQAIHQLSLLLGQQPMALSEELSDEGPMPAPPPEVPIGMPSQLLRRRADVRRAERQLAASTARVGVAVAQLFPRFSLTGSLGLESNETHNLFNYGSRYYSIGPSISWPILDFGRIRSNINVQNAVQEQAAVAYEQTVLVAFKDVEDALVAFLNEQTRRKSLAESVRANRRALEISNRLYTEGRSTFLNVLDAERSLLLAEDALVQSDRAVSSNLVALYKALGGGWEMEEQQEQPEKTTAPPPQSENNPLTPK